MLIAQHVPDDVWAALPPRRLPRWRVIGALALLALVAFGIYALSRAGLVSPSITSSSNGGSWTEGNGTFSTLVTVTNDGSVATTISGAAVDGGWVRLDRVTAPDLGPAAAAAPDALPITLGPHEGVTFEFWFTVTDCTRISRSGLALTVTASAPLRTATVAVTPADSLDPAAPSSFSWSGGVDPWRVPWPGVYAASACGVPLPPKPQP